MFIIIIITIGPFIYPSGMVIVDPHQAVAREGDRRVCRTRAVRLLQTPMDWKNDGHILWDGGIRYTSYFF